MKDGELRSLPHCCCGRNISLAVAVGGRSTYSHCLIIARRARHSTLWTGDGEVCRAPDLAFSIDVEESAGAVLRLFADYPIHHLPVVSGRGVVGMLSSADVMKLEALRPKTGTPSNDT